MISWRHSFKRLNEEYEISKKKKHALDNLLSAGKISRQTYEVFNEEISGAIAEIEKQQKALLEKMDSKASELDGQIKTLEMLLANFEIQHVAGEVDEETYQSEINVLLVGLETARKELNMIKEAMGQISANFKVSEPSLVEQSTVDQPQEHSKVEEVIETKTEICQPEAPQEQT
ncbi:MAG: CdvA-like protein [Candidatus Bathyarchaeia archaeon]